VAHKAIHGSKLEVLPTGHAVPIEAPDKFNTAVVQFLNEVKTK
jgi:pimeloyl-ACP methyl ester carboxylesterase